MLTEDLNDSGFEIAHVLYCFDDFVFEIVEDLWIHVQVVTGSLEDVGFRTIEVLS